MSIFASESVLRDLTEYERPKDQIKWLRLNCYPFAVSRAGKPKVLMAEIHARLRSQVQPDQESPDFTDIAA